MSELRERVARAIYDAPDSQSGDVVGTVIWNSEHLFYDSVEGEEIVDTARRASMPVCLSAADAAIAAVLDAMQEPSEAVWDGLPRDLIMWMDMEPKTPRGLFRHLKLCRGKVPEWLTKEPEMGSLDHTVSKGSRAVLVYKAMLAAFRREALGEG